MVFILYQSALPCAKINFQTKQISLYNPYEGSYENFREITQNDKVFIKNSWRFSIDEALTRFNDFPQFFGETNFKTKDGMHYVCEDGIHYLQRSRKFPLDITIKNNTLIAFTIPAREEIVVLVKEGEEEHTSLHLWQNITSNDFPITKQYNVNVPMRDRIILKTDIYLPDNGQQIFPTVLIRTCYNKDKLETMFLKYTRRGFAVVIQDVRGREQSEGKFQKFLYETDDGSDTLDWIVEQPWSNGQIGMTGGSYLGYVQWAAASSGNPHLKAITSFVTAGDSFKDNPRKGGALMSCVTAWFFSMVDKQYNPQNMQRDDWDDLLEIRPIQDIYKKAFGKCPEFVEEYLSHKNYDEFWDKINWHGRKDKIKVPALVVTGWFDDNGAGSTDALEVIQDYDPKHRKVIMGPWQHSGNSIRDLNGVSFGNNCIRYDIDIYIFQWLDIHLNKNNQAILNDSPVEYYTAIDNTWKNAQNWPVEYTTKTKFYLTSGGKANSSLGDGGLLSTIPTKQHSDTYLYDPKNPAINLIDLSENEGAVPANYIEEEKRQDIICYSTSPLKEDMTITGDITATIYVSADVPDTDFVVRILDVDNKNNSIKIADGILTARYREGFDKEVFIQPNEIVSIKIRTSKISWTIKKGHQLRFHITSGAKNFIFPHSNTKEGHNSLSEVIGAITVHHGGEHSSYIDVPIEN